ncbi:forespore capture DNA-binding protein RefZ [Calidifontibacillus oryziterrae]|uniref:forespore capture DNA-binding protein RefZ n=1 Tax=Calidifontibacillus oryziterrae TaxID=1191699 RepID=UPI00047761F3|nr:forespore capture DNA-binding protein RefZ [Calidifontibacillus oryziterrae]
MSMTKQKVFDAALTLFNSKGYNGTSVREIAKQANVNIALISYYFDGKKGLLEQLMIYFLEQYIAILSLVFSKKDSMSAKMCLQEIVRNVLIFESENHQLARLVHREVTVDTILIREIMTTYLTKERYILQTIIETGIQNKEFKKLPIMITIAQLKGLMTMPYLQPQYMVEVLHINPVEPYFVTKYFNEIDRWIDEVLCLQNDRVAISHRAVN